ncbi:methyltransferase domain-containing protein [Colletotrichum karsti]|uniref:Methyltransferase domain-containing protein n=1 Tax=Colletotrichum karsti TaxID=1095194 RepID=A0A9P6I320_9PEZI|nr:methyltransferase domain-containing protein [Colletotrichum karsti]KAF9873066.1 methyltransferase domain-containing protein [Colletotrichum karsti]
MDNQRPTPNGGAIPADPIIDDDTDEAISIYAGSSVSLSDSIRQYREIHGRTYTRMTAYWGPNDEIQNELIDFNHCWITEFLGGRLFLAPISEHPQKILDLGTGTGIWAIDMADEFPSAEVIGTDLSPTQPEWTPPNCRFHMDDFELEWRWPDEHFDYNHGRNLEACFAHLPATMKEAFKHTKPGGYIEFLEFDSQTRSQSQELPEDHVFKRSYEHIMRAARIMGKPGENVSSGAFQSALEQAGYVNITRLQWRIPIGGWCLDRKLKSLGWANLDFLNNALEGFGLYLFTEVLGFTYEKTQELFTEYKAAMGDPRLQPYYHMQVLFHPVTRR